MFDHFVKLVLKGLIQLSEIHWAGRIKLFTHFGLVFPMFLYPMKNENIGKKQVKKNVNSFSLQKHPPEVFYKKTVLKDFATFTGKHLDGD